MNAHSTLVSLAVPVILAAGLFRIARTGDKHEVEVTKESEDSWLELIHSGPGTFLGTTECTPGYYNNEGQPTVHGRDFLVGFPLGAMAYFEYLESWRASGKFEGLDFRAKGSG